MAIDNDLTNRLFSIPYDEDEAAGMYFAAQGAANAAGRGIKAAGLGLKSLVYTSPLWLPGLLAAACGQIPIPTPVPATPTAQVIVEPTKQEQMKNDLQNIIDATPTATETPTPQFYTPTATLIPVFSTSTPTATAVQPYSRPTDVTGPSSVYAPSVMTAPATATGTQTPTATPTLSAIPRPSSTSTPPTGQQGYATQAQLEEIAGRFVSAGVSGVTIQPFTRSDYPNHTLYMLSFTVITNGDVINGAKFTGEGHTRITSGGVMYYTLTIPDRQTVLEITFPYKSGYQPTEGSVASREYIEQISGGSQSTIRIYIGPGGRIGANSQDPSRLPSWSNAGVW